MDTLSFQMQRSGNLQATASLIAQGESIPCSRHSYATGTPPSA